MTNPQRPRAFRLPSGDQPPPEAATAEAPPPPRPDVRFVEEPYEIVDAADGVAVPVTPKRRAPWLSILFSALGGLVTIAVGLSVERLIADLFATAPWLGWVALALLLVAVIALTAIVAREALGVWRERKIEALRERALAALSTRDHTAAQEVVQALRGFYADRPALAGGVRRLDAVGDAILDVDDRLALAEGELLAPSTGRPRRPSPRRQARSQPSPRSARGPSSMSPSWSFPPPGCCAGSRQSMAGGPACSASSGSRVRRSPISPSPAAWPWARACCTKCSASGLPLASRPSSARACSTV
ncbi:hypothetical protein GCM10025880_47350 [Methylorubrum aminovorans]|nr:hypothetical protein GCM10025880_47350 [Methylorubrum aminovorans]